MRVLHDYYEGACLQTCIGCGVSLLCVAYIILLGYLCSKFACLHVCGLSIALFRPMSPPPPPPIHTLAHNTHPHTHADLSQLQHQHQHYHNPALQHLTASVQSLQSSLQSWVTPGQSSPLYSHIQSCLQHEMATYLQQLVTQ